MQLHDWDSIPKEQMNPLVARQALHTANMTVARIFLAKGAVVPEHTHHNEQVTQMLSGSLRFVIGGKEIIAGAGQVLVIPPHAPHSAEALEDSLALDTFAPRREDWIRGDDAYLRK